MPAPHHNSDTPCFHCGLPLDLNFTRKLKVLGQDRDFCCPGCHTVCDTIVKAGLEDYYSHRREKARTADVVPEIVQKLGFYDHPDVQKSFVRGSGTIREASLLLENIRCAACLWLNEQALRGLEGVLDVELDYASNHARVRWDPTLIHLSEILEAVINIGYVAHPYDPTRREQLNQLQRKRSTERLIFAGVIGMMVMQFAIAGYVMGYSDETGELALWVRIGRWTSLFATTLLLVYPGQEFFTAAWRDLRNRRLGMDVPIVLGLSIAYLGSLHTTWTQSGEVYYDSIAMFVFLVLLARRTELRGRVTATDALDRVGKIVPRVATRLHEAGEEQVHVTDLQAGDTVRVRPGEIVPTDGRIVLGTSSFDESLLTGESLPVSRTAGDEVIGGACNVDQAINIEVTSEAGESTVAEIHRLLAGGLRDAPRYAELAQQAAGWFVGAVLLIALVTATTWLIVDPALALPHTVAVLIVTCPCALALATPVAAAISTGRLADTGVIQTRGDALEALAQCDAFVFDKTGTLTRGELALDRITGVQGMDHEQALAIARVLEQDSEHPIGKAIVNALPDNTPAFAAQDFHNTPGLGVEGMVEGERWRLGKPEFAARGAALDVQIEELRRAGFIVTALSNGLDAHALFAFRDQMRSGVPDLMRQLRCDGVSQIIVLSGDAQQSVDRCADGLDIDIAKGDCRPTGKLRWIRTLQQQGARVAMVGDGINDAPTLAAADVSVSFAHATELAQMHSGILLLGQDISVLSEIRAQAQQTRRIIRQNLAWAATYNLLAVPAAALGMVPPWGAAIGMSASSLLVVVNALRLRARRGAQPRNLRPSSHTDKDAQSLDASNEATPFSSLERI